MNKTRLKFTKMHGLGNDFVVLDATRAPLELDRGLLDQRVKVATRGGELSILWEGECSPVQMTGPAVTVFEGELEI